MPRVRFEPTIPAFKRTKTVHALDRAAITTYFNVLKLSILLTECIYVFRMVLTLTALTGWAL
jgi:hypothetical protein